MLINDWISDVCSSDLLLGGHPALDFINTVDWRDRADAEDCLVSYAALLAWARRVGLLDAAEAKALALAADAEPEAAETALSAAVDLRETLYRLFGRKGAKPADLERLNHWLAEMPETARLGIGRASCRERVCPYV